MKKRNWQLYGFLCCALFCGSLLTAQETFDAIKIYGDFYLGKTSRGEPNLYLGRFDQQKLKGITVAYQIVNPEKKYSKELELGLWTQTRNVTFDSVTYAIKDFEAAARFEWGVRLEKKLFNYIIFTLNPAIDLYFYEGDAQPISGLDFPASSISGGMMLSFIPHIEIPLGERLFLDLNINFINISFGLDFQRKFNPAWTERQQKTGGFSFNTQGEQSFQIGLGYKLFPPKNNAPQD